MKYSTRPTEEAVALDQACLNLVFNHISSKDDDAKPLQDRINKRHRTHTVEYAEQIGLGARKYTIVSIDKEQPDVGNSQTYTRLFLHKSYLIVSSFDGIEAWN